MSSTDKATVHLVRSNGDRHYKGGIGGGHLFKTVRVECSNGVVVLVSPDGSTVTTTVEAEREARWAEHARAAAIEREAIDAARPGCRVEDGICSRHTANNPTCEAVTPGQSVG